MLKLNNSLKIGGGGNLLKKGIVSVLRKLNFPITRCENALSGFTLSEVLITLGVIGVVAALTIPGLITKYQEIQYRVTYRKTYSSLNQLMRYLQEDDAIDLSLNSSVTGGGLQISSAIGQIFNYMSRYYNAKTTCLDKNVDKCWVCEKGEAGSLRNGGPDWLGCNKSSYAFIDASGVAYYLYSLQEYPLLIDVNGSRSPNQLGRDRFVMYFGNSLDPKNKYPDSVDAVFLWHDIIGKQRWCPQGNCLYKTWIQKGR